eukprot:CAMPEP_0197723660 /NCGR_PEP_ID=MMETSP1434-20131217/5886_1 /TAXON_ID=265543 /ORGANISM="Minutocellus polymorphus, Strain CCMP3303" /LENGTH=366 /DNA_ID=CAMNT_0043308941 /DNA_START=94 /DNA_END=1194 /DNA_ORIENTATION=-
MSFSDGSLLLSISALGIITSCVPSFCVIGHIASLLLACAIYAALCVIIVYFDSRFVRKMPVPSPVLTVGERSRTHGESERQWVTNFRTLGGLPIKDREGRQQKRIKPNAAYRCGAINGAMLDQSALDFPPPRTLIDLRAESEARGAPTILRDDPSASASSSRMAPKIVSIPSLAINQEELRKRNIPNIKDIMKLLVWRPSTLFLARPRLDELTDLCVERLILEPGFADGAVAKFIRLASDSAHHPVCLHCTEGKDRTGGMTALLLLALGVSREVIIEDFILSNKCVYERASRRDFLLRTIWLLTGRWISFVRFGDNVKSFMFVNREVMQSCLASVDEVWGGFNEKYWKAQGLTMGDIQRLRDAFLM